jgi:hypothetical protein
VEVHLQYYSTINKKVAISNHPSFRQFLQLFPYMERRTNNKQGFGRLVLDKKIVRNRRIFRM